ncbi:MAG: class I SAM-dependent methyltransferase [Candidatus Binataceae bacterium]
MAREHPIFSAAHDLISVPGQYLGMKRARARLVADLSGKVLEIGVGTGLNLGHYRPGTTVAAIDPDLYMLRRARPRAAAAAARVWLLAADGEVLPFRSASFDAVVATHVFCTIPNPAAALAELRRVLKAGGELHFVEHVRAPGRWLGAFQDAVDPVSARLFGGCHLNRETIAIFQRAGFRIEHLEQKQAGLTVSGRASAG